ncbi:MAG: 3-isopropylmalate dehydratase [Alphaproteobacteria bacterium]|nr:3-isopropylmalate dehydratase [Alphaproteobacteria bacterium]
MTQPLVRKGRVWVFGDNINTDLILPSAAFRLPRDRQHRLAFEAVRPGWVDQVREGDVIVGGANFGMGSGRPVGAVFRACGIAAVVAESVNGLCLRNCINVGLPALSCRDVGPGFTDGETAEIDFRAGIVRNLSTGRSFASSGLAPELIQIIEAGGIAQSLVAEGLIEAMPYAAPAT